MYKFKTGIDEKEYTDFLLQNPYYSFMQLPEWAQVKDNWGKEICGLYDDGKLVAAALLLIRSLPLRKSIIYSPRGFTADYSNKEQLKAFTDGLKKYAGSIGAISIKIDPFIPRSDIEGQKDMPPFGQNFDIALENLKELGYIHHGFGKELGDYFQPRFNMAIPLFDENGAIDKKKLLRTFSKGARSYIGNYHKNRGVTFEIASNDDDLSEFIRLLSFTEKRQSIHLRNAEYFRKILNAYGERAKIYYAKIHLPTYIEFLGKSIQKGENVEKNQKLCDDAKKVMQERGEEIYLSTGLMIFPKDGEKIKIAEYLYAGTDTTVFPNLSTPNGIVYRSACDSIDRGCLYYNLGGVDGDLKSPLAIFKQKFAPHILEFVGEFDLPVRRLYYFGFEKTLPAAKKLLKKIRRK